jgi:hypothetical protein
LESNWKPAEIGKIITNMSLKSYLDPVKAFDKWIIANPKGGIFVWKGIKLEVKPKNVLGCT